MKQKRASLHLLTLKSMLRRKWSGIAIILMIALGMLSSIVLSQLTIRQQNSLEQMIATTEISCTVTDARGMNSNDLNMISVFTDMLLGRRPDKGDIADYVCNVKAVSSEALVYPKNYTLRRILSIPSDKTLERQGVSVEFFDGWDEDVLKTNKLVCLIPEKIAAVCGETISIQPPAAGSQELKIIGIVHGIDGDVLYCPLDMLWSDVTDVVYNIESCSFSIRDNSQLDKAKEEIYKIFCEPSLLAKKDGLTFGVIINDEVYLETLNKLESNISMLKILLPVLLLLCCCIGFFTSFLSTKGRIKEFAVMRCIGLSRKKVFASVFEEFIYLSVVGGAIGFAFGLVFEPALQLSTIIKALLVILIYLAGASISVLRICNVNVMNLMKEGE